MQTIKPGITDAFRAAFEAVNGRSPTIEETKDALRLVQVAQETMFDPLVLMFIADVKGREQRERLPDEVRTVITTGLTEIREAIPSGSELRKRLDQVETFRTTMDQAQHTIDWIGKRVLLMSSAVGIGLTIGAMILAGFVFHWGYGLGYEQRSNTTACAVLANVFSTAKRHQHLQTTADMQAAYGARLCGQ